MTGSGRHRRTDSNGNRHAQPDPSAFFKPSRKQMSGQEGNKKVVVSNDKGKRRGTVIVVKRVNERPKRIGKPTRLHRHSRSAPGQDQPRRLSLSIQTMGRPISSLSVLEDTGKAAVVLRSAVGTVASLLSRGRAVRANGAPASAGRCPRAR
jgi:hypothetical protein